MALGKQQSAEPVRFYVGDDHRLPRRLSAFLTEQIAQLSHTVLQGQLSHDDYKDFTGQLRGLKLALEECERIATELAN
jgi:hypothetical protein